MTRVEEAGKTFFFCSIAGGRVKTFILHYKPDLKFLRLVVMELP
jgi:hypothetical protein